MSLATTKPTPGFTRDKLSSRLDGKQIIERTAKIIRQDSLGALAFFAVAVTGIGSLIGRTFNTYWYFLTLLLVGLYVYQEFFIRQRGIITGKEMNSYDVPTLPGGLENKNSKTHVRHRK